MKIIVFVGQTAGGKTTLAGHLLNNYGTRFGMVTSLTTRAERKGKDLPGEYEYVNKAYVDSLVGTEQLLWTVNPHGDTVYATTTWDVDAFLHPWSKIGIMILTPDVIPILQAYLHKMGKNPASVFYVETKAEVIEKRLKDRKRKLQRQARIPHELAWKDLALTHGAKIIDNNGPIGFTARQVLDALRIA